MKRVAWFSALAIGAWVLVSFAGTMFDPTRAELWTQSLMASLVVSLLAVPLLMMFGMRSRTKSTSSGGAPPQADPFVDESSGRMSRLWPEEEKQTHERETA